MLTPEQQQTLKAYIAADPVMSLFPKTGDGAYACLPYLNAVATPDYIVWKTSVSVDEIMRNGMDWARVDNLSVGKARIWDWMTRLGTLNASKTNIRAGIDAAWVGTAADLAVRATVYTHCKRQATALEKLLATGSGSDASPSSMGAEGQIGYNEVEAVRNLP